MPERYVLAIVPDELWAKVEPILPQPRSLSESRRLRALDRTVLAGILFVVLTGIKWMDLPLELGCSGSTCRRRLKEWHASGAWARILEVFMRHLPEAQALEWCRATLDPADIAARKRMSRPPAKNLLDLFCAVPKGSLESGHMRNNPATVGWPDLRSNLNTSMGTPLVWPNIKYPRIRAAN